MFKESVIENRKKKAIEKKQRLNVNNLKNRFLAEWASNILELNSKNKKKYIDKVLGFVSKKDENNLVIKKIEKDFTKHNIKISFDEIKLKDRDFYIKANIVVQNKFKRNNWK